MDTTDPSFTWLSPLGGSVAALLACSAVYALIALTGLALTHRYGVGRVPAGPSLFLSPTVEEPLLGRPTADLMAASPGLARILGILMDAFLALMLGFAVMLAGLAWFGVRSGEGWALWSAILGNAAMLAVYWGVGILPFLREASVGYGQVWHPYAVVPTVLVPVAAVLGWIGAQVPG